MVSQLADDLGRRGAPSSNEAVSLGNDLIWGVSAIAQEIGRTPRQAFHMLENETLPAKKVGGRWCASKAGLRKFFAVLVDGEVA